MEKMNISAVLEYLYKINDTPRFPIINIVEALTMCYLVRKYAPIRSKMISLLVAIVITSMTDNAVAVYSHKKIFLFENPYMLPIAVVSWLLLNFFPFDLLFKTLYILRPICGAIAGILLARASVFGIETAIAIDSKTIVTAGIIGFVVAFLPYAFLALLRRPPFASQARKLPGISCAAVGAAICSGLYIALTDIAGIIPKPVERRLVFIVLEGGIAIFGFLVALFPTLFLYLINGIQNVVGFIVPYYGGLPVEKVKYAEEKIGEEKKEKTE